MKVTQQEGAKVMSLFNNIGSLMNTLMQPNDHEETKNLANKAGVDTNDFSKIASIGLPLLFQGMNRNNQSKEGLDSFNQALNEHQARNNYESVNEFSRHVDPQEGDKIVNHVFHNEKDDVSNSLADRLGVSPQTVKKTLAVLAPIAIKYLADRKKEQNLDDQGVQRETETLTREAAMKARDYDGGQGAGSGGLLGNLVSGLTQTSDNKNKDGLLGNLFDIFK